MKWLYLLNGSNYELIFNLTNFFLNKKSLNFCTCGLDTENRRRVRQRQAVPHLGLRNPSQTALPCNESVLLSVCCQLFQTLLIHGPLTFHSLAGVYNVCVTCFVCSAILQR